MVSTLAVSSEGDETDDVNPVVGTTLLGSTISVPFDGPCDGGSGGGRYEVASRCEAGRVAATAAALCAAARDSGCAIKADVMVDGYSYK